MDIPPQVIAESLQHGCPGAGLCHRAAPPPLLVWFHAVQRDTGSFRRHKWMIDQCGGALLPKLLWAAETLHCRDWRGLWKRLNGLRIRQKGRREGPGLWALPIKGEVYCWTGWDPGSMTDIVNLPKIMSSIIYSLLPAIIYQHVSSDWFWWVWADATKWAEKANSPIFPCTPTEGHSPNFLLDLSPMKLFINIFYQPAA